ncbi:MAG: metallophosphoesterase family protein [Ignavibacteria bacterium]
MNTIKLNPGEILKKFLFPVIYITVFVFQTSAQPKEELRFNDNGRFRIVQITDVHLKIKNQPRCDSVINTIINVVKSEKPDLVILTGDIVTAEDVEKAWSIVTKPMIDEGIPWAVVFGNHDYEHGYTNKQIMDYLETLPLNYSEHGPEDVPGVGNYVLEIKASRTDELKAILYCMDSNAYTEDRDNEELGKYGWIKFDQIKWYREQSKLYTQKNKMEPLPALAFFHIPLPEYSLVKGFSTTVGDRDEKVASPKINSGMYNALLESKDVMGVFCGHDHNNNYIGALNNICLAYGCKAGKDSYGKLDKGGRVIVLYEDERKFDTWIHTTKDSAKYFVTFPGSFKK